MTINLAPHTRTLNSAAHDEAGTRVSYSLALGEAVSLASCHVEFSRDIGCVKIALFPSLLSLCQRVLVCFAQLTSHLFLRGFAVPILDAARYHIIPLASRECELLGEADGLMRRSTLCLQCPPSTPEEGVQKLQRTVLETANQGEI